MLPLRDPDGRTEREDSFEQIPEELDPKALREASAGWRLDAFVDSRGGKRECLSQSAPGTRWVVDGGDVVSAAPELARLSLNVAAVHHDRHSHREGRRLVYGGHTIGLAAAQASRLLPEIATIAGWHHAEKAGPSPQRSASRAPACRQSRGPHLPHLPTAPSPPAPIATTRERRWARAPPAASGSQRSSSSSL
jgi:hypothetical protein